MVLCPDVFEANWEKTGELVTLCDSAVKAATTLYQKVSLVLCVLSVITCDLILCFLNFVWSVGLHLVMSPHPRICGCDYKVVSSSDGHEGPCKSKTRLLNEMEDRLLCLLCAFLISSCLPARRGVWVEGKVLWILYNSLLFFPGHHDGFRR